MPDVSDEEVIRFGVWLGLLLVVAVAATAVAVRSARARPANHLFSSAETAWWLIGSGGSVLLVSLLGGLFVFRASTKWEVVLTWPLCGGVVLGLGYAATLALMGQMEPGSALCTGAQSCDTQYGLGAIFLAVPSGVFVGMAFMGMYALKRVVRRVPPG